MVLLLKFKDSLLRIVSRHEAYILALIRFVVAFAAFGMINFGIGGFGKAMPLLIALVLAAACAFLPIGVMVLLAVVLIVLNFYTISSSLAAMAALLFVIMFLLYFRFSPGKGWYAVLTPVCSAMGIPYVMPVSLGLVDKPVNVISVLCGSITWFMIRGVRQSASLFTGTEGSLPDAASQLTLAGNLILGNREMYIYLAAYIAAAVVVWLVSRVDTGHSREKALLIGCLVQLLIVSGGQVALGQPRQILLVLIGTVVSALLAWFVAFLSMSLDYSRVERLQFEDDEYFYYVKAVPKSAVAADEKTLLSIRSGAEEAMDPEAGFFSDEGGWGDDLQETLIHRAKEETGEADTQDDGTA